MSSAGVGGGCDTIPFRWPALPLSAPQTLFVDSQVERRQKNLLSDTAPSGFFTITALQAANDCNLRLEGRWSQKWAPPSHHAASSSSSR